MLSYLWGGSKAAAKQIENEDPKVALQQALDDHSDFKMTEEGILEFDDFCHLRSITLRQALRAYEKVKDQFDAKRIECLMIRDY